MTQALAVTTYMPAHHIRALQLTAGHFHCWILVRRGNPQSLQWIGKSGYIPKLLDCKAKTAQYNVHGRLTAGLVVSPEIFPDAFEASKLMKAKKEWRTFAPQLYIFSPDTAMADDRAGKHYTLQLDEKHPHYGCVMFKPVYRGLKEFLHGDYDLYAVVPESDPRTNVRVQESGYGGAPHSRSPLLYDVQYYFKTLAKLPHETFASPMIRHGEQETFKTDWDDQLDVFWPDGSTITELNTAAAIQEFYAKTLQGREQFHSGVNGPPHRWQRR
ncbi:MAG: hypothetical protein R2762_29085 [Bryobacteraceae bacterium]